MFKVKTDTIKIPKSILLLTLVALLAGCQPAQKQLAAPNETNHIISGKPVAATNIFSKRVIYLALGVKWETGPAGNSVTKSRNCTASALSPTILITAAHCVIGMKPSDVAAVLSNNPWNHTLNFSEWVKVTQIIIHEDFIDSTNDPKNGMMINDLALIKLAQPLSPDRVSRFAPDQHFDKNLAIIAVGYGKRSILKLEQEPDPKKIDPQSETLLSFIAKSVENFDVAQPTFSISQLDQTGICEGDSGGPSLIYDSKLKDFVILGITSFYGTRNDEMAASDPKNIYNCSGHGIFSNALYFADWIERTQARLN